MDAEKVDLLFDGLPRWADPDNPDDRAALFAEELGQGGPEYETGDEADGSEDGPASLRLALRQVIAYQIAEEDPPRCGPPLSASWRVATTGPPCLPSSIWPWPRS